MKRAFLLITAALTACGGTAKIDPTAARNALPTSASVQIVSPGQSSSQAAAGSNTALSAALAGGAPVSGAYQLTSGVSSTVNLGVGIWIGLLEFVVALPPTSCTVDTCTWGPWAETNPLKVPASYRLTVTKEGDAQYSYRFSAAPGATTAFVDIVYGSVSPNGVPHHGAGSFTVDYDAGKPFNASSDDTGRLVVTHSNVAGLQIGMTLTGGTEHNGDHQGELLNAAYAFDQNATAGDLQVALHYLTSGAEFTLHSRWDPTGAGRCDIDYQAQPAAGEASECWGPNTGSPAFALAYNSGNPQYADPSACVFQGAAYATLTVQ